MYRSPIQWMFFIIFCGVLYGGYEYYIFDSEEFSALQEKVLAKKTELQQKKSSYEKLKVFSTNIEKIKQELNELNLQLESLLEHMPKKFNVSGLLRKLTVLAQNSGVELSSFRPIEENVIANEQKDLKQVAEGDVSKKNQNEKNDKDKEKKFYASMSIEFDLKGSFPQELVFLDQLSRLKRIIQVDSLKMTAKKSGKIGSPPYVAEATGKIRTYRFLEQN